MCGGCLFSNLDEEQVCPPWVFLILVLSSCRHHSLHGSRDEAVAERHLRALETVHRRKNSQQTGDSCLNSAAMKLAKQIERESCASFVSVAGYAHGDGEDFNTNVSHCEQTALCASCS